MARFNHCHAIGCLEIYIPAALFCERHDRMLQSDLRTILGKHWRSKAPRQSKLFDLTLTRALHEILYAQTSGHRMPRDADFDFSEGAPADPLGARDDG